MDTEVTAEATTIPAGDAAPPSSRTSTALDTLVSQVTKDDDEIAALEEQIKALQRQAAQLKANKTALAAFADELKASSSAVGQAQNKAKVERESAAGVASGAAGVAGRLAEEHVAAINKAVAAVEADAAARRAAIDKLQRQVAAAGRAETEAKAASSNAKIALADAKKRLADLAKEIDGQTARVKALKDQATDAAAKSQDRFTYLLMVDLHAGIGVLGSLLDPARAEGLKVAAQDAWDAVAAATAGENEAIWASEQGKKALLEARDALAALEKNQRKEIENRLDHPDGSAAPATGATALSSV